MAFYQGGHSGPWHREVEPKQSSAVSQSRRARDSTQRAETAGKCRTGYQRGENCEVKRCLINGVLERAKEVTEQKTEQQIYHATFRSREKKFF